MGFSNHGMKISKQDVDNEGSQGSGNKPNPVSTSVYCCHTCMYSGTSL